MSNITVIVELCAEDRARLDRIAGLLADNQPKVYQTVPTETAQEPATAPEAEAPVNDSPAPEAPEQPEPAAAEEPVKTVTKEELQALVQELAAPGTGKRDAVKAIVQQYAKKVSDIPEDKRAEVMQQLIDLKEGKA